MRKPFRLRVAAWNAVHSDLRSEVAAMRVERELSKRDRKADASQRFQQTGAYE